MPILLWQKKSVLPVQPYGPNPYVPGAHWSHLRPITLGLQWHWPPTLSHSALSEPWGSHWHAAEIKSSNYYQAIHKNLNNSMRLIWIKNKLMCCDVTVVLTGHCEGIFSFALITVWLTQGTVIHDCGDAADECSAPLGQRRHRHGHEGIQTYVQLHLLASMLIWGIITLETWELIIPGYKYKLWGERKSKHLSLLHQQKPQQLCNCTSRGQCLF